MLIEALDWVDLSPRLKDLAQAQHAIPAKVNSQRMIASVGPRKSGDSRDASQSGKIQLAKAYEMKGFVLDFEEKSGSANSFTFLANETYLIKTAGFGIGSGTATFQANSIIKYENNAYLYLYGPVSFPTTGLPVIFTSKDDDLFGKNIDANAGLGATTYHAAQAIWLYYLTDPVEIRNARIRCAQKAIQVDTNPGYQPVHTIRDTRLEKCQTGVYLGNSTVSLVNVKKCDVTIDVTGSGSSSGTMTRECGELDISVGFTQTNPGPPPQYLAHAPGTQAEAAVAVHANLQNVFVLAVPDPKGSTLKQMASKDGGTTWSVTDFPPSGSGLSGACCDPAVAYDKYGNLFAVYLNTDGQKVVLAMSTDHGATFQLVNEWTTTGVAADATKLDRPTLAVGPSPNSNPNDGQRYESLWVSLMALRPDPIKYRVFAYGFEIRGAGIANVPGIQQTKEFDDCNDCGFGYIAIGPTGQTAVSFITPVANPPDSQGPSTIYVRVNPNGINSSSFSTSHYQSTSVGSFENIWAGPDNRISVEPVLAWDRSPGGNGRLYLAFTSQASETVPQKDDTDVQVKFSTDAGVTWSSPVRVNDDPLQTPQNERPKSQFLPHIAVDQTTGKILVIWHDSRNDPGVVTANNPNGRSQKTQLFGAFSTNGGVSFQLNFIVGSGQSDRTLDSGGFDYGDYTGIFFQGGVAFPAWADNSNSLGTNPDGTSKFDVHLRKLFAP